MQEDEEEKEDVVQEEGEEEEDVMHGQLQNLNPKPQKASPNIIEAQLLQEDDPKSQTPNPKPQEFALHECTPRGFGRWCLQDIPWDAYSLEAPFDRFVHVPVLASAFGGLCPSPPLTV